jgi:hypothetical protein
MSEKGGGVRVGNAGRTAPEHYRDLVSTPKWHEDALRARDLLSKSLLGTTNPFKIGRSQELRVHKLRTRTDGYYRYATAIFRLASFMDKDEADDTEKFLIGTARSDPEFRGRCRNKQAGGGKKKHNSAVYLAIFEGTPEQPFFVREPLLSDIVSFSRGELLRNDKLEIIEPDNELLNQLTDLAIERRRLSGGERRHSVALEAGERSFRQISREMHALALEEAGTLEEIRLAKNRLFAMQDRVFDNVGEMQNAILDAFFDAFFGRLDELGLLEAFGDGLRRRMSESAAA